jgi:DNA anti-recombination protein RmuC
MYNMRESWTDERLDDFRGEVNRRFDDVYRRFDKVDKRFDKVDDQFDRVHDRLDGLHKVLIFTVLSLMSATLAGYGALIALVITRT